MRKKILTLIAVFSMLIVPAVSAEEVETTSNYIENVVSTFDVTTGGKISFKLKQDLNLENGDYLRVNVSILTKTTQNAPAMTSYKQNYEYEIYRNDKKVETAALKAGDKISITGIAVSGDTENTWQKEMTDSAVIYVMKEDSKGEELTLSFQEDGIIKKEDATESIIGMAAVTYMKAKYPDKEFITVGAGMDGSSAFVYNEDLTKNATVEHDVSISTKDKTLKQLQAEIDEQMKKNTVQLYFRDGNSIMNQEILEAIKDKKYIASVVKYNSTGVFTWEFDGTKIDSTDFEIDLTLNIGSSKNQDIISSLLPKDRTNPFYLDFSYEGTLPKGTSMQVVLNNKYGEGDYLTLYYYNESTKQLEEEAKNLKVENNRVQFTLEHCSEYVLSKQQSFIEETPKEEVKNPEKPDEEVKEPENPKDEVKEPETPKKEEISTTEKEETPVNNAPSNAQTSSINIVLYIALAMISLIGIIWIVISNKKKIA